MKLGDTSLYVSLALQALGSTVEPDLQSPAARDALNAVKRCLEQVLARRACNLDELRANLIAGEAVARRLGDLASLRGVAVEGGEDRRLPIESLAVYAEAHERLSSRLATLVERLSRSRIGNGGEDDLGVLLRQAAKWEADAHAALLNAPAAVSRDAASEVAREALEAFLCGVHDDGDAVRVADLSYVPGGFGKHTYLFTLHGGKGRARQLVLRKNDRLPPLMHPGSRIDREFHYLRAIAASGFLAPKPLWLGMNVPGFDADFFIMERVPGRPPGAYLTGGSVPESVALDMASCIAQLHRLRPADLRECVEAYESPELLAPGDTVEACNRRIIASWRSYVQATDLPASPFIEYVLDWLETNVPKVSAPPVLIHGDYNIHNVLADADRISAVLDWEVVGFGAPEQDIGYLQPVISRYMSWDKFYAHYLDCGGRPCDFTTVPFYQVFGALRVLLAGMRMTHLLQQGATHDIRHTAFEFGFIPQFMKTALDGTAT